MTTTATPTAATPVSTPLATETPSPASAKTAKPVSAAKAPSATTAKPLKAAQKPATKKVPEEKKTTAAKPAKVVAPMTAKDVKTKKPKLVRDSFTIPKDEYAVIETLKQKASALAQPVKKSELLRAGLKVLATLSDSSLRTALQAVPSIKTGRPKAEAAEATKTPSAKPSAKSTRK